MQSLLANTKVYPQIWHSVFRGLEVALAIHSFSCHNFSLWRVSGLVAPGLLLELCGWVLPLFVLLSAPFSPLPLSHNPDSNPLFYCILQVKYEGRTLYLTCVCMSCLDGTSSSRVINCR